MKSLSAKTFQCGVTVQGLTTLSGTVYLTALTNTATWDYVVVGTTAQGQLYTRTYAQLMSDITSGIGLSGYVPTSRTLTINGVSYDLTANRSWTISTPYVSKLQHTVKAGLGINKGQAVYVTGADGTNMIVGLASNASEATSSKTMGLLDATVSTNGFANVVTEGLLDGLDTSTAGAAGDPVWLGTGGNLIYGLANKPYAPAHLVFIGIVTRKNNSNGEIFVKVQNGFELREIHDVDLITTVPVNGHILGFDGTLWVNKTIAGWLGYTPANASGTTNYISKFTGSTTLGNSLIYDDGSGVGIGTTSPSSKLSIVGPDNASGLGVLELVTSSTNLKLGGNFDYSWIQSHNSKPLRINELGNNVILNLGGGNTGIGTSSPSYKLDVYGSPRFYGDGNHMYARLSSGASNKDSYVVFNNTADRFYVGIPANSNNLYIQSGNGGTPVSLVADYTSGNVGIGTTNPGFKLDVNGSARVNQGGVNGSGQALIVAGSGDVQLTDGGSLFFGSYDYGGSTYIRAYDDSNIMYFYLNGTNMAYFRSDRAYFNVNVGIGTSNPTHKLTVTGDGSGTMKVGGPGVSGNYTGISLNGSLDISNYNILSSPTDNHLYINRPTGNNIYFRVNNNDQVIINSSGNVGIGTSSPSDKLSVVGNVSVTSGDYRIYNGSTILSAASPSLLEINAGGFSNVSITNGNVGIGTTSPATKLDVSGVITATGGNSTNWNTAYGWGNHSSAGYVPQTRTLTINGTSYDLSANRSWTIATTTPGGSDTQFQYNSSGSLAGASALTYNSANNRIGVNQASPGYDFDVNGQVRVQDKLRVGTVNSGNGVVHMSSSATINPSATTIVWAQNVSVGMCAFIEYYILNNNSLTDQRAGTIMVTWNQSGTPTIAHTETTTPDIGSTIAVNFTSSLVGSDARINAVNSSANPYTIVMSYKYF